MRDCVREKVIDMLEALDVLGVAEDPMLDVLLGSVEWRIKNAGNLSEVPEGLESIAVEMGVGEYLAFYKTSDRLSGFDLDTAVKSIQEGDTNVSFATGEGSQTPEQRLDALISRLRDGRVSEILRYRKIQW